MEIILKICELNEIMEQKDDHLFAIALNISKS